jgi:allophanate hydrolase subunit 1
LKEEAPISSLIAEIFLQNYEDKNIKQFLEAKSIIFYVRSVEDILIIFDKTKISPQNINTHIKKVHNNIKLNPTLEEHTSVNFLDVIIRLE